LGTWENDFCTKDVWVAGAGRSPQPKPLVPKSRAYNWRYPDSPGGISSCKRGKLGGGVCYSMDIDDILADLDRTEPTFNTSAALEHQQLTRFWISERAAPEVLKWPTDLMDRVMARIRQQIETIEDLTAGMGMNGSTTGNSNSNLTLSILQTDLSRTQYIIRSLLRQRLAKLTKHAMHYLTAENKSSLLSTQEQSFLQSHQGLLSNLYGASFLSAFPPQLQRLDDNAGGLNMVDGPDGKKAVFIRCLSERWSNDPAYDDYDEDDDGRAGDRGVLVMQRGQVWVVRWEDVKKGVEKGALELL
jgi:GINS complex subunit 4